jgi:hypothetical protein
MAGIITKINKAVLQLRQLCHEDAKTRRKAEPDRCRLKAAILLESMIAMIIIMLCFGLAVMIFTNVTTSSKTSIGILARARINTESEKTKAEKRFLDENFPFDEFTLRKRMLPYGSSGKVFQLHFSAVTPGHKILAESDELVYP